MRGWIISPTRKSRPRAEAFPAREARCRDVRQGSLGDSRRAAQQLAADDHVHRRAPQRARARPWRAGDDDRPDQLARCERTCWRASVARRARRMASRRASLETHGQTCAPAPPPLALLQRPDRARARAPAATPSRIIPPPVPRRRSIISSRPRGAGGDFAFGRPARACCSSSDHDRAGAPARARHARQAPPSCAHMMPSLHVTGRISAPRYIQTFAFGAIDAPSATHGGEPLTHRIDFFRPWPPPPPLEAPWRPGLAFPRARASDHPGRRVAEH